MNLPTFIIVGAQRSGTTSLNRWLAQHPEVYMSVIKEPNFFVYDVFGRSGIGDKDAVPDVSSNNLSDIIEKKKFRITSLVSSESLYQVLFEPGKTKKARGETSVSYLYFADISSKRIYQLIPHCRIILVLRDPVERAWSAYKFFLGREYLPPKEAFLMGKKRVSQGWEPFWDYLGLGLYAKQVKAFLDVFPREQVGIWLYEDLMRDKERYYREILQFIGVDDNFLPDFSRENASSQKVNPVTSHLIRRPLVKKLKKWVPRRLKTTACRWTDKMFGKELHFSPELRKWLTEYYKEDILLLHELLPHLDVLRWIKAQERKIKECQNSRKI